MTAQDQQSRAEFIKHVLAPNGIYERGIGWVAINSAGEFQVPETLERWVDWQAAWQAARAMPADMEPMAWLHINGLGAAQAFTIEPPPGFKAQCAPLYTAAQVQAMGRVPPGWQAVPVEPTIAMLIAGDMPRISTEQPTKNHAAYAAMLAAAPRPPAAQEQGLLQQFLQAAKEAGVERLNIPVECWCESCDMDKNWLTGRTRMALCPQCGNKRCPRATHHDNACTGSNEPGQRGSNWEHVQPSSASKPTP